MKNKLSYFIWTPLVLIFLQSCGMERQLAMQFIDGQAKSTHVMLVPPDLLHLYNNKQLNTEGNQNSDSLRFYSSKYVQYLSDSIFLENYFKGFTQKTQEYGLITYFPDDLNEFVNLQDLAYIMRFAQMELVEDTATYLVEEKKKYQSVTKKIIYNTLGLSSWFEISMKDSANYYTYFDDQYIADEINGEYRQEFWSMDIVYDYTSYEIEEEDIYNFAFGMGENHASYLFDLLLNSYIWDQLPEENRNSFNYLHYNATYHSLEVAEEAFIMLENQ